ncbi:hypothetical protein VHEMI09924 [[Torrubiella] hemipterigena]|uniref:tripeptidyl-peptidase II n=1 Tax=[Torrubiella] hemipterigena TaxID=1531966 RepID=A0A0A1TSD5_9HYPO|nr:hypothetical protein VHEMI09924 [[Torrubiella] hemipterigena]
MAGKWLTKEQVTGYAAPSDESIKLVKSWIKAAGIADEDIASPSPDWLHVRIPVSKAEELLEAEYKIYNHAVDQSSVVRTTAYSIPQQLLDHIDTIQPTTAFQSDEQSVSADAVTPLRPAKAPKATKVKTANPCDKTTTPQCVLNWYNVDHAGKGGKTSYGISGPKNAHVSHSDLKQFLATYDPKNTNTFQNYSIADGINNETAPTRETTLDIQWSTVLGAGNSRFYTIGRTNASLDKFEYSMISRGTFLASADSPPDIMSTSYGAVESRFTKQYATRICNDFMKASSRGITVLFSTGDNGVGETCSNGRFENHFPGSCPWVLAVGATEWSGTNETATTKFGSGGGFSDFFDVPAYHKTDVADYIRDYVPASYDGKYNAGGRAYPDVALIGERIPIYGPPKKGNGACKTDMTGGTSASTPMWAGLLSQINDYRATIGKPTLGFINPRLYGEADVRAALNDITVGSNPGSDTDGCSVEKGWDPVTGLGSMDFAKLRVALST